MTELPLAYDPGTFCESAAYELICLRVASSANQASSANRAGSANRVGLADRAGSANRAGSTNRATLYRAWPVRVRAVPSIIVYDVDGRIRRY